MGVGDYCCELLKAEAWLRAEGRKEANRTPEPLFDSDGEPLNDAADRVIAQQVAKR